MPPSPYNRPPAGVPASQQVGRLMGDVERLSFLAGAGDLSVAEAGQERQLQDYRPTRVYAKITGAAGGTGADYPWSGVDESSATLPALTNTVYPLSGTATSIPFREINGRTDVASGTRVRGDLNASQDAYLFSVGSSSSPDCTEFDDLDPRDCLAAIVRGGVGRCGSVVTQQVCLAYDCAVHGWVSLSTVTTDTGTWTLKVLAPSCAANGTRTPLRAVLVEVGGLGSGSGSAVGTPVCGAPQGCRTVDGVKYAVFSFGGALLCGGTRTPCGKNSFEVWVWCGSCSDADGDPGTNPCLVTLACCPGVAFPRRMVIRFGNDGTDTSGGHVNGGLDQLDGLTVPVVWDGAGWSSEPIALACGVLPGPWVFTVGCGLFGGVPVWRVGAIGPDDSGLHTNDADTVAACDPFSLSTTVSSNNIYCGMSSDTISVTVAPVDPETDPCPPGTDPTAQWYCVQISSSEVVNQPEGPPATCALPPGAVVCLQLSDPDSFTGFTVVEGDVTCGYGAVVVLGPMDTADECGTRCS